MVHIKRIFILLILSIFQQNAICQLNLTYGSEIFVKNGTEIIFVENQDSLIISDSSRIKNDGIITFSYNNYINESPGFPVYGNGFEQSSIDQIYGNLNLSNLGFSLTTFDTIHNVNIKRFHSDTLIDFSSYSSVKRYFVFESDSLQSSAEIIFNIDSTELNGLSFPDLTLIQLESSSVINRNGAIVPSQWAVESALYSSGIYTLSETRFVNQLTLEDNYCPNDTLHFNLQTIGIFNPDNNFVCRLINFSDTINYDTISNTIFDLVLPAQPIPGTYAVYIQSTSPSREIGIIDSINIYPPIIFNTSFWEDSICANNGSLNLNLSPVGGQYFGSFISGNVFQTNLASAGQYPIEYYYTDINNCSAEITQNITVVQIPNLTVIPFSSVCDNYQDTILQNVLPLGGIYFGNGVSNNYFSPHQVGAGIHYIQYTITEIGCSDTTGFFIEVLPSPLVNNSDTSICFSNDSLLLNFISPAGGVFNSLYVTSNYFQTYQAPIGNNQVLYSFTDINGCSSTDTFFIITNPLPSVVLNELNPFCTNSPFTSLNVGTPSGGFYSGIGVISDNFYPSIAGPGQIELIYTYTDANNCTSSDTSTVFVFQAPSQPIITGNGNVLSSSNAVSYQWYQNGVALNGETNQFLTVNQDGFYQVEIADANGCTEISESFDYNTSSINTYNTDGISIFPNPTEGDVYIQNSNKSEIHLTIYNLQGKVIYTISSSSEKIHLDLHEFSGGTYYCRIKNSNSTNTYKIIVL